jgi:hypothetical protein
MAILCWAAKNGLRGTVRIPGFGSVPKCHGFTTLAIFFPGVMLLVGCTVCNAHANLSRHVSDPVGSMEDTDSRFGSILIHYDQVLSISQRIRKVVKTPGLLYRRKH